MEISVAIYLKSSPDTFNNCIFTIEGAENFSLIVKTLFFTAKMSKVYYKISAIQLAKYSYFMKSLFSVQTIAVNGV